MDWLLTERGELTEMHLVFVRKTNISGNMAYRSIQKLDAGFVQSGFENFSALLHVKQSTQPHPNGNITDGAKNTILPGGGKC